MIILAIVSLKAFCFLKTPINTNKLVSDLYSVGSDSVIKKASSENGKVSTKNLEALKESTPTVIRINEKYVAVGDEDSTLTIFDQRSLEVTHTFPNLHFDMITSIVDMSFKNAYHFITTGSTTLVHLDIRKGVLTTSEEHNDEFLCGCVTSDSNSVFGMSEGTITTWDNSHLESNEKSGMTLSEQSIDCIIAGEKDDEVYCGSGDGNVYKLNVYSSQKEAIWTHSKKEEVSLLDFDNDYRLVSGSMETIKIWRNPTDQQAIDDAEAETEAKEENEKEDSDEESKPARKKNKSKKGQVKTKRGRKHVHGISSFEGL